MARYIADQNKVLGLHESGTYAIPMAGSSFWMGQIQSHTIEDLENPLENRFLGTSTRSKDSTEKGPQDVTGTISYHPQDMRLIFCTIGSIIDVSGTNSLHSVSQINSNVQQSPFTSGTGQLNAPISFTIEDSKQAPGTGRNFIRTIKGAVPNTVTLTATQGEKVVVELEYIGQSCTHSSGTTTAVTQNTTRPYLWSDCQITLAGSVIDTIKEAVFEINQNREAPHYLAGSRTAATPINGNREYTVTLTTDLDADDADMLYGGLYKAGSEFNLTFNMNGDSILGSKHATFYMSGCRIITMDNPSENEGLTESTIEIRPKDVTGSSWEAGIMSGLYNPY